MHDATIKRCNEVLLALSFTVLLSGCVAERLSRDGSTQISAGQLEQGMANLEQAAKEDPDDFRFRTQAINKRIEIVNRLFTSAQAERTNGNYDEAENLYRRALKFDANNVRAQEGLAAVSRERGHAALIDQARTLFKKGDSEKALALLQQVNAENPGNGDLQALKRAIDEQQAKDLLAIPTLKSLSKKPISLEFRDANLKMVFEVLSRTTGINFVLDKDVRSDLRTTLFLKQSSLEDAVDLLLAANQLEKKVLNQNSILIFPSTAAKLKDYQDLLVKSFYLANADVKQTLAMIKTMLKTKDVFIDEKLNLLIMRDTPEAIRLAEKLIAMQDLAEPEVMLEVEVLEVKRSRLLDLGIQYPNQLTLTPLPASGTTLKLSDLRHGGGGFAASIPSAVVNLRKEDGDVNLLANPRIRVRNREKAKILIGDKVPVITTTSTSTGFVSENVQYVDVGLKLEVEPNIYLEDDVAIKVALEVSSIVRELRSTTGSLTYQIGTRNASSVLRLKDGETQVLAGLISDEDRSTASKIPGLGELPLVGRLFSSHRDDHQKTEIVLSITPRLIRNLKRPNAFGEEFWSGTEAALRTKPLVLQTVATTDAANSGKAAVASLPLGATMPGVPSQTVKAAEPAASGPTSVALTWQGPPQVKVGEQFKVTLRVRSDGAIRSLPFQVGFDPKILQMVEIAEGGFFKQGDAKTNFTSNIDQTGGKAFVGVARVGADGAKGDETVATITFKAITATARAEIKLLAATPISSANSPVPPALPAPYAVGISN